MIISLKTSAWQPMIWKNTAMVLLIAVILPGHAHESNSAWVLPEKNKNVATEISIHDVQPASRFDEVINGQEKNKNNIEGRKPVDKQAKKLKRKKLEMSRLR